MNESARTLPNWVYYLVILSATIIWGGDFVIAKTAVSLVSATWVVAIRFFLGGLLLAAIFAPRMKRCLTPAALRAGMIIGVCSFLGYWTQFVGLSGTTPAKNAFLSTCYCVVVPFVVWIVQRQRPTRRNLLAACICVAGLALVTLPGGGSLQVSWGDGVSMLSALTYSFEIVAVSIFLRDNDVIAVSAVQMVTVGLLATLVGCFEGLPSAEALGDKRFILAMLYITLLASTYGATAQNLAQRHIAAGPVSMLLALESVFGTIFSVIFFHEVLTLRMLVGFALIFTAVVLCTWQPRGKERTWSPSSPS